MIWLWVAFKILVFELYLKLSLDTKGKSTKTGCPIFGQPVFYE
jgi:hypothetical protein